jgi:hypothetical protein
MEPVTGCYGLSLDPTGHHRASKLAPDTVLVVHSLSICSARVQSVSKPVLTLLHA